MTAAATGKTRLIGGSKVIGFKKHGFGQFLKKLLVLLRLAQSLVVGDLLLIVPNRSLERDPDNNAFLVLADLRGDGGSKSLVLVVGRGCSSQQRNYYRRDDLPCFNRAS